MITMVRIAATRNAWDYLNKNTIKDDAAQNDSKVSAYYVKGGNPPGTWMGSGLANLNLEDGRRVDGVQLERLFGEGKHPLDPMYQLGKPFAVQQRLAERIRARLDELPTDIDEAEREVLHEQIIAQEGGRPTASSVSGFEFVFNPPKSVSAWWALADPAMKEQIRDAHHAALKHTLDVFERDVAKTRIGTDGVVQVETQGVVAAAFDHWETREGDPQLHTHLLISNRVQGPDGKWRTLDSRHALSPSVVTLSTRYDAALRDELSMRFGVQWVEQTAQRDRAGYEQWLIQEHRRDTAESQATYALDSGVERPNHKWEIAGVPMELLDAFSTRAAQVRASKDGLIAQYVEKHGRQPSMATILKMRAASALRTRQAKKLRSLKQLTRSWRATGKSVVGDTFKWADEITLTGQSNLKDVGKWSFRADDLKAEHIEAVIEQTLADLARTRSTWTRWNAEATVVRVMENFTFRSFEDRDLAISAITDGVLQSAIPLTPKTDLTVPWQFQAPDGSSRFHPESVTLYTTQVVWEAEEALLAASRTVTDLTVDGYLVDLAINHPGEGKPALGIDQAEAVRQITSSGLAVDALVGPAGAGKTTTLRAVRSAWEAQYGAGTVRGLAPTARAAEELADALEIPTENTAKWVHETTKKDLHTADFHMRAGDLIIIDEASIGGTLALEEISAQASKAGAKILLVGDWAQLAAVDAGGAFGMIVRDRGDDITELSQLWRFTADWEKAATVQLRLGRASILDTYVEHDRVSWGYTEALIQEAIDAWKADETSGLEALLVAPTNELATQLNDVARQWRVNQGLVDATHTTQIQTGVASVGDRIVTRHNDRTLMTDGGKWVRNNDEWRVVAIEDGGSIVAVTEAGDHILLPGHYVREYVQLAYACTSHRAQGRTVDSSHAIVDSTSSRETFYVAMSRGKSNNHAYVSIDSDETMEGHTENAVERSWREVLNGVLGNTNADLSAHDTVVEETARLLSIKQLAAEYETIAAAAREELIQAALKQAGLDAAELADARTWPALQKELSRFSPTRMSEVLTEALQADSFEDAVSAGAVLTFRLAQIKDDRDAPARVAGVVNRAEFGIPEWDTALAERATAIEQRSRELLEDARAKNEPWVAELTNTTDLSGAELDGALAAVAAFRERFLITSEKPFGDEQALTVQQSQLMQSIRADLGTQAPRPNPELPPQPGTDGPAPAGPRM